MTINHGSQYKSITIHASIDLFHLIHFICCGKKKIFKNVTSISAVLEKSRPRFCTLDKGPLVHFSYESEVCCHSKEITSSGHFSQTAFDWALVRYCLCYMASKVKKICPGDRSYH